MYMVQSKKAVSLVSAIDGDDDLWFIRLDLFYDDNIISTLEFAEITDEVNDLIAVNKELSLYDNNEDLLKDMAEGHINKYLGIEYNNEKLNLLFNIKAKVKHQQKQCSDGCIFCNPELGIDPFPNFTFNIQLKDPEGSA